MMTVKEEEERKEEEGTEILTLFHLIKIAIIDVALTLKSKLDTISILQNIVDYCVICLLHVCSVKIKFIRRQKPSRRLGRSRNLIQIGRKLITFCSG